MTMPNERTRALRWAGEFLREIQSSVQLDPGFRRRAATIPRHYPTETQLTAWVASDGGKAQGAPFLEQWLGPESEDKSDG